MNFMHSSKRMKSKHDDELIQAQSKDYFDNNLDCSTSKI